MQIFTDYFNRYTMSRDEKRNDYKVARLVHYIGVGSHERLSSNLCTR